MAKLALKFEDKVLKEITLGQSLVTIGRLPDNTVQIDNLAVSGHHAKIYWETDHYVVEDNNSLNGTFINNRRITKQALQDGDSVLIGKHILAFKDEWHEDAPTGHTMAEVPTKPVPKMEATMVLDTKKAKEMMAQMKAGGAAAAAAPPAGAGGSAYQAPPPPPPPMKERVGTLSVISGKTDQPNYTLTGKMTVIGKSEMASIKLRGWFKPQVAAAINRSEGKYLISASERKIVVKVNGQPISGQHQLNDGDIVEVSGVQMTFGYAD
ncbi:MAG TPA: FHA domain-containing protein [Terriglobales bacterium]|nr:FHA domain-containing protein [Terriglobales bacterium]